MIDESEARQLAEDRERMRRAGVSNTERHLVAPGDKWAKRRAGTFDRVLVDAPCTGTGTWRRNPDARLRLRELDLQELVPKQASILDAAARLVRPGGVRLDAGVVHRAQVVRPLFTVGRNPER